jgi:hypothetical protein
MLHKTYSYYPHIKKLAVDGFEPSGDLQSILHVISTLHRHTITFIVENIYGKDLHFEFDMLYECLPH